MWGHRFKMLQLSRKMWELCFWQSVHGEVGSKLYFPLIDEKIAGESNRVCVKIHRFFFNSVHEMDRPSNRSI